MQDPRLLDRLAGRIDALRTTLPEFTQPQDVVLDLSPLENAGYSPELIALVRTIAAEHGRDVVLFEDFVEAEDAWKAGRRPRLH